MRSEGDRKLGVSSYRSLYLSDAYNRPSSKIIEILEDSSSDDDSTSEENLWVVFPLESNTRTLNYHSIRQARRDVRKEANRSAGKHSRQNNVYYLQEGGHYSLISLQTPHSHRHFYKNYSDSSSEYSLVIPTVRPRPQSIASSRVCKCSKPESKSEILLFPIQRKMRPTHSEGVYAGSRPVRSVSRVSLERKQSHSKTRNRATGMHSLNMSGSLSRLENKEYCANSGENFKEIAINLPDYSNHSGMNRKPKNAYEIEVLNGY